MLSACELATISVPAVMVAIMQNVAKFAGFTRPTDRKNDVFRDNIKVTLACFAGVQYSAEVPVERMIAEILRATWPLLPISVTITLPRVVASAWTVRSTAPPISGDCNVAFSL